LKGFGWLKKGKKVKGIMVVAFATTTTTQTTIYID